MTSQEVKMIKPDVSQRDELTGLFNRKAFLEKFRAALTKAKINQHEIPLSMALIDVDHFKILNDEHGHVMGDKFLAALAEVIKEHVGGEALVGRYGGDEFAIIFPGDEREQAFLIMEQIRQTISQREFVTPDGKTIPGLTISGGVASFPVDGRTENELFRKADHALYRAKAGGRGRIRLAYEERMVPKTTHYTQTQLERLSKLAEERSTNEADLLREAMDDFLTKYGVNDIES
jgi:diguanylate cyclase (GGDEF)-like protein